MAYHKMAKHYEALFPMNKQTFEFLSKHTSDGQIIDLACGTGAYSRELARLGHKVLGIDLDEGMIQTAKELARQEGLTIQFQVMDMITGIEKAGKAGLIYCIGNSIVHLKNDKEVLTFLQRVKEKLLPQGKFILGLLNYDRILSHKISELAEIRLAEEDMVFQRSYHDQEGDEAIMFRTTLIHDGVGESDSTRLLLLDHRRLEGLIQSVGFTNYQCFGGFDQSPYKKDETYTTVWVIQ